jgi:hypothetical protein
VLRRLSVFPAADAGASHVCGDDGVSMSTSRPGGQESGIGRGIRKGDALWLLESVRHYARDRLRERRGSADATNTWPISWRRRDAEPELMGPMGLPVDRLESERDNAPFFSVPVCRRRRDRTACRRGGAYLGGYVGMSARAAVGFRRARRHSGRGPCSARPGSASMAGARRDCSAAREEALIQRQLSDRLGISRTLTNLGNVAVAQDDSTARARFSLDDVTELIAAASPSIWPTLGPGERPMIMLPLARSWRKSDHRARGGRMDRCCPLLSRTLAHDQGDRRVAQTLLEEALAIARKEGSCWRHASQRLAVVAQVEATTILPWHCVGSLDDSSRSGR